MRPCSGAGHSPIASRASMSWPTISPASRLRTRRCVPVWQNLQLSVQPTCEETQRAPLVLLGNMHGLDQVPVGELEEPLARTVRGLLVARHLRAREDVALGKRFPEARRERGHRGEARGTAAIDPMPELMRRKRSTPRGASSASSSARLSPIRFLSCPLTAALSTALLAPPGDEGLYIGVPAPPVNPRVLWFRRLMPIMVSEPQHIIMMSLVFRVDGSGMNRRSRNTSP